MRKYPNSVNKFIIYKLLKYIFIYNKFILPDKCKFNIDHFYYRIGNSDLKMIIFYSGKSTVKQAGTSHT